MVLNEPAKAWMTSHVIIAAPKTTWCGEHKVALAIATELPKSVS